MPRKYHNLLNNLSSSCLTRHGGVMSSSIDESLYPSGLLGDACSTWNDYSHPQRGASEMHYHHHHHPTSSSSSFMQHPPRRSKNRSSPHDASSTTGRHSKKRPRANHASGHSRAIISDMSFSNINCDDVPKKPKRPYIRKCQRAYGWPGAATGSCTSRAMQVAIATRAATKRAPRRCRPPAAHACFQNCTALTGEDTSLRAAYAHPHLQPYSLHEGNIHGSMKFMRKQDRWAHAPKLAHGAYLYYTDASAVGNLMNFAPVRDAFSNVIGADMRMERVYTWIGNVHGTEAVVVYYGVVVDLGVANAHAPTHHQRHMYEHGDENEVEVNDFALYEQSALQEGHYEHQDGHYMRMQSLATYPWYVTHVSPRESSRIDTATASHDTYLHELPDVDGSAFHDPAMAYNQSCLTYDHQHHQPPDAYSHSYCAATVATGVAPETSTLSPHVHDQHESPHFAVEQVGQAEQEESKHIAIEAVKEEEVPVLFGSGANIYGIPPFKTYVRIVQRANGAMMPMHHKRKGCMMTSASYADLWNLEKHFVDFNGNVMLDSIQEDPHVRHAAAAALETPALMMSMSGTDAASAEAPPPPPSLCPLAAPDDDAFTHTCSDICSAGHPTKPHGDHMLPLKAESQPNPWSSSQAENEDICNSIHSRSSSPAPATSLQSNGHCQYQHFNTPAVMCMLFLTSAFIVKQSPCCDGKKRSEVSVPLDVQPLIGTDFCRAQGCTPCGASESASSISEAEVAFLQRLERQCSINIARAFSTMYRKDIRPLMKLDEHILALDGSIIPVAAPCRPGGSYE